MNHAAGSKANVAATLPELPPEVWALILGNVSCKTKVAALKCFRGIGAGGAVAHSRQRAEVARFVRMHERLRAVRIIKRWWRNKVPRIVVMQNYNIFRNMMRVQAGCATLTYGA